MKTNSPLIRVLWSMGYVIVAVVGLRIATAETSRVQDSPRRDRTVVRKPWSVEPVKVLSARNKKGKIELGKPFDDDDDWLDGFAVTVFNGSDRTVTAMNLEMVFRREPGDTRPPAAEGLYFGPSPSRPEYLHRDRDKIIKPGETREIVLTPDHYQDMKVFLDKTGFPLSINRVELVIREVGFDDDSMLLAGTLYLPDPMHPNDPTKKIRANKKFHHGQVGTQIHKNNRHRMPLKTPVTSSTQTECHAQDFNVLITCEGACHVARDVLDSLAEGNFTTQEQLVRCTSTWNGQELSCTNEYGPLYSLVQRYVECCHPLDCEDTDPDHKRRRYELMQWLSRRL